MNENLPSHTIYLVTGGVGAVGESLVLTILPQFPGKTVNLVTVKNVRFTSQIDEVVERAKSNTATLLHTLVDPELRIYLVELAARQGVFAIDLMRRSARPANRSLGTAALGQPGQPAEQGLFLTDRIHHGA
jgi:regulator of PEP synthase PpsR (kinase-PPPase family)